MISEIESWLIGAGVLCYACAIGGYLFGFSAGRKEGYSDGYLEAKKHEKQLSKYTEN